MQPSPKLPKSSKRKVRSHFLLPLAFCLLPVTFYLPPHAPTPVIAQTIDARKAEADRLLNQGLQQQQTSQHQAAIQSYEQALAIYRSIQNRNGEASALNNLGDAYRNLSQPGKAIEFFQQALPIFRQAGERNGEANALMNLGLAYADLSQYSKAMEFYQQALPIFRQVGNRNGEAGVLNNLGNRLLKSGNVTAAEKTLFQAVTLWESLRPGLTDENKVSLFERQSRTYRSLQEALIAQNKPVAALEVAERGRAKAFVELLAERLNRQEPGTESLAGTTPPTIEQIRQVAKAQNATLVQYSIIYRLVGK